MAWGVRPEVGALQLSVECQLVQLKRCPTSTRVGKDSDVVDIECCWEDHATVKGSCIALIVQYGITTSTTAEPQPTRGSNQHAGTPRT